VNARAPVAASRPARRARRSRPRANRRAARSRLAQHADARLTNSGSALLDAAAAFERLHCQRYAIDAAVDAARAFLAAGRQDSARRAAARARARARARELIPDGQGGSMLPIDGLSTGTVALTPRESQLIKLDAL
jgi:hypothetical protein